MITYNDFAKLEILIGEIIAVEVVADADKLLRLTVNLGEGIDEEGLPVYRQIISGIRTFFDDPQTLVGTKCPFLANLEHRTIRGFESEGMILAGSTDEGTFALLIPSNDLPVGTRIS